MPKDKGFLPIFKKIILNIVYFLGLFFLFVRPRRDKFVASGKKQLFLFISCFRVGDSLFLTPIYREIKNKFPQACIWVLVDHPGARDILKNNPHIDQIIFVKNKDYLAGFLFWAKNLKNVFTVIFDYSANFYWSLIAKCLRHKFYLIRENQQRIGHFFFKNFERFGFCRPDNNQYVVDYYLSLADFLPIRTDNNRMEIFFSREEKILFKDKFSFLPDKYAVFHLGADNLENIWPYWPELSTSFIKKFGIAIVFTGTEKDVKTNPALAVQGKNKDKIFFLAGTTTIREAAWLISNAQYYVGGDTGLTHVAISFKKRTVMIFGRAEAKMYCPDAAYVHCLRPRVSCYPCYTYRNIHHRCPNLLKPACTASILPEDVLVALSEFN